MTSYRTGAIALTIALLTSACGSSKQPDTPTEPVVASSAAVETHVITADDGSAELSIPASALPDGTSAAEISVTHVTAADLGTSPDHLDGAEIYSLEPDGLQLGEGATLSTTITSAQGFLPQVFHLSAGQMQVEGSDDPLGLVVETVDGVQYDYHGDTGETAVDIPVAHFSSVIVTSSSNYAYFQMTANRGEAVLGQMPDASGLVAQNASSLDSGNYPGVRSFNVHYSDQTGWPRWFYTPFDSTTHYSENEGKKGTLSLRFHLNEESVIIHGNTQPSHGTTVLDPEKPIHNRPPVTAFGDQFTIPNADFTCDEVGDGHLNFKFLLEWTEKVELQRAWDPTWRPISDRSRTARVTIHSGVKCTAPSAVSETGSNTTGEESEESTGSDPTEPTDSTGSDPTEPTESTGSDPTEPTDSTGSDPTEPTDSTETAQPAEQVGSAAGAVGINGAEAIVDGSGAIWWVLYLGEGWSPTQFRTFFSMYFALGFTGPVEFGSYASCQTHAGVVSSYGSRARGEFMPRAFFRPDGAVLLESGSGIDELPPGTDVVNAMVESGVWESEAGDPAQFSNAEFALPLSQFGSGDPLSDPTLTPACEG